jgi:ATP-dependent Lon protease
VEEQITADINKLRKALAAVTLPADLEEKTGEMINRLARIAVHGNYSLDFEQTQRYIDWITHLPWSSTSKDILDLGHNKQVLDSHHFGLEPLKERFLEYLSLLILNARKQDSAYRAPILLLVGLVGTGKTTIAKSISEALGRQFVRIPFGGMSSALDLRGQSRAYADAEPGLIIKGLRRVKTKNPVILLDEIDRVSDSARGEIMGVLVELLDPEQNNSFTDHYIDYPFDLSQVMFIATANNTTHISTAVIDRLEPVIMPSYTDEEKIHIARDYVLPHEIKNAALPEGSLKIEDSVWPKIVRPLGFDAGIRTLERTVQGVVRKCAKQIVEGKIKEITLTENNIKPYLPS